MSELRTADGGVVKIKMTLGSLKRFEARAKLKFFDLFFNLMTNRPKDEAPKDLAIRVFKSIFAGIEEAAAFLYECAVFEDGKRPGFDEFCDSLPASTLGLCTVIIMDEVRRFLPEADEAGADGGSAGAPLDRSGGGTSGKQQG